MAGNTNSLIPVQMEGHPLWPMLGCVRYVQIPVYCNCKLKLKTV